MLAGIRDLLLISTPQDTPRFERLFGDGNHWELNISYTIQASPNGLAQAFILGKKFIGSEPCALIFGDNIFYGHNLATLVGKAAQKTTGATVFAYPVNDPERYGVVEFDKNNKAISIEEKPESRYTVTGLYFYDNQVADIAKSITPSPRGELEITDVNKRYLEMGALSVKNLGRGMAWLDTGMHDPLLEAAGFVETLEKRQGLKIVYPEEIAYQKGYITADELYELAQPLKKNGYGQYLLRILDKVIL